MLLAGLMFFIEMKYGKKAKGSTTFAARVLSFMKFWFTILLHFCNLFHVCIPKWYCNGIKKKCLFIHQIHPHIPLWFEMVQDFQIEFRVWRLYSYEFRICSCESIMRCWRRSNKSNSFDTRYVHILQGLSKYENTIK